MSVPSIITEADILSPQRDKAWAIHPYPCIGQFRFLDLSISAQPAYPRLLSLLKSAPETTFLDLGCCFGQDIRKLVYDGVKAQQLFGAELRADFFDLGYELFKDRKTLGTTFLVADVFDDSETSSLNVLEGKTDIVYAASFLHLFNWDEQIAVCKRIVKILRPQKGSVVFGRQVGTTKPGLYEGNTGVSSQKWRHDEGTFKEMWEQVGQETGTEWTVDVTLQEPQKGEMAGSSARGRWNDQNTRRLRFEVERVK